MVRTLLVCGAAALAIVVVLVIALPGDEAGRQGTDEADGGAQDASATAGGSGQPPREIEGHRFPGAAPSDDDHPRVLVLGPDDRGIAGARVLVHRGDDVLGVVETAADGGAALPDGSRGARAVAVTGRAPPLVGDVPAAGPCVLRVRGRARLAGRVTFVGSAPDGPLHLALSWDAPGPVIRRLPRAVREAAWERHRLLAHRMRAAIGADGTFAFAGLPPDWSGHVVAPDGWVMDHGSAWTPLERPREDVEVSLVRLPAVRGRLVVADGTPAAGGRVAWTSREHHRPISGSARAGPDGRFRILLRRPRDILEVVLRCEDASGLARREIVLAERPGRDHDLGDVRLPALRDVSLLVVDLSGSPVAGAAASVRPDRAGSGPRSGPDGRIAMRLGPDDDRVWVAAAGHATSEVPVPAGARPDRPVRVTLGPTNALRLTFEEWPDLHEARVVLLLPATHDRPGAELRPDGEHDSASSHVITRFATRAPVVIEDLPPELPLKLEVRVRPGVLVHAATVSLGAHERRHLAVPPPGPDLAPRASEVIVTDSGGRPLPRAQVSVIGDGARYVTSTDGAGRTRVQTTRSREVDLLVARRGYVPSKLEGVVLEPVTRVTLERSRLVMVSVRAASGEPLAGIHVRVGDDDRWATRATDARGRVALDAPHTEFHVSLRVAGRRHRYLIDATAAERTITLPRLGTARLALSEPPPPGSYRLLLVPVDGTDTATWSLRFGFRASPRRLLGAVPLGVHEVRLERRVGRDRWEPFRHRPWVELRAGWNELGL